MHKARILIVEDEWIVAMDLNNILINLGHSVCGISDSGEEAIQMTDAERPDLVMMDINLSGKMNGIEAAKHIYEQFNVPVIYLTAYSNLEILEHSRQLPGHRHVFKPFSNDELMMTIEEAIGNTED